MQLQLHPETCDSKAVLSGDGPHVQQSYLIPGLREMAASGDFDGSAPTVAAQQAPEVCNPCWSC